MKQERIVRPYLGLIPFDSVTTFDPISTMGTTLVSIVIDAKKYVLVSSCNAPLLITKDVDILLENLTYETLEKNTKMMNITNKNDTFWLVDEYETKSNEENKLSELTKRYLSGFCIENEKILIEIFEIFHNKLNRDHLYDNSVFFENLLSKLNNVNVHPFLDGDAINSFVNSLNDSLIKELTYLPNYEIPLIFLTNKEVFINHWELNEVIVDENFLRMVKSFIKYIDDKLEEVDGW